MPIDTVIAIIEILGGVAFSLSGAAVAIEHRLDIFGVLVLGLTTAAGGGIIRDMMLGITPPAVFANPLYLVCAFIAALLLLLLTLLSKGRLFLNYKTSMQAFINVVDAVGLGIFAVLGTKTALAMYDNYLLAIFIGAITAVGGGILRDISVAVPPKVFRKHIYAVAAIGGCVAYCVLSCFCAQWLSMLISMALVITVRILSAAFKWNLPIITPIDRAEH